MQESMQEDNATSEQSRDRQAIEAFVNGPYVIRNFTSIEEYGEYIKEEDVIRPLNSRWCNGREEASTWKMKSTARCPTYGTCLYCMMAGHVGQRCQECNDPSAGFVITSSGPNGGEKYLDSINLARLFGIDNYEVARSDRRSKQHMQRQQKFGTASARVCAERMYKHIQDPVEREDLIKIKVDEFESFLVA